QLHVYNVNGQEVKEISNIAGNTITLNRDNLLSGVYFVRLIENNKVIVSERIVIAD
ncbi:T9SS type A sorting domain-containing protein, partial [Bacteroidota bacterium]